MKERKREKAVSHPMVLIFQNIFTPDTHVVVILSCPCYVAGTVSHEYFVSKTFQYFSDKQLCTVISLTKSLFKLFLHEVGGKWAWLVMDHGPKNKIRPGKKNY